MTNRDRTNSKRVAASFNEAQVLLMHEILTVLTRGGDPRMLARSKTFGPLVTVVASMRRRTGDRPAVTLVPAIVPADGNDD